MIKRKIENKGQYKKGHIPWSTGKSRKVTKKCITCAKEFVVYPYRTITAKTCSFKCAGLAQRTKEKRECIFCNKEFMFAPSQSNRYKGAGKYCSYDCSRKGIITETRDKPITDRYGRSRRHDDLIWQKAVREKDNFTCQRCGVTQKYIHTHHVATRARRPDLKHVIENGKCLCNSCHSWVHHYPKEAAALNLLSLEKYEMVGGNR